MQPVLQYSSTPKPSYESLVNRIESSGFALKEGKLTLFAKFWLQDWHNSPQSRYFEITDWLRVCMTAVLVDQYVYEPSKALLAEIRINESYLAGTMLDRHKMQLKFDRIQDNTEDDIDIQEDVGKKLDKLFQDDI